jgi:DNA-binding NtrC family response regulator
MESKHVIVAGPDPGALGEIAAAFRGLGYQVIPAEDAHVAGEALSATDAEYLVLGLGFPRIDLDALRCAIDPSGSTEPETLDAVERRHIESVLQQTGGNRSRAARLLGISRSTLLAKIRRYGLA